MPYKAKSSKRIYWLTALVLIVVLAVASAVAFEHHRKLTSVKVPSTGPVATTKSSSAISTKSSDKTTPQSGSSDISSKAPQSSSDTSQAQAAPLMNPSGDFVSNHHPGQNGTPTTEVSVCNTTPGATCYIQFTMGSNNKKLDSETTNSSGTAIWYWDVSTGGFSQGSWQVSAIASLNGQTKISQDSASLVVQP